MIEPFDLSLSFLPVGEAALLVRVGPGETISHEVVDEVVSICKQLDATRPDDIVDIVPAYCTILISYDQVEHDHGSIESWVRSAAQSAHSHEPVDARVITIPAFYGGDYGPDLEEAARLIGLPPEEVVERHVRGDYRVACTGFSPGWAYLIGLDPALAAPRLPEPRVRVPAGSVAIGGAQTGVYPSATPGGWRLIGRTPLAMFDPARADPFTLKQGDRVRFERISAAEYGERNPAGDTVHG